MKFYGHGALRYPGTKRVIHDFEDGPFSTVNPEIIRHALAMGFSTEPLPEPSIEPEPIVEQVKRKPGRPPKEKANAVEERKEEYRGEHQDAGIGGEASQASDSDSPEQS